MKNKSSSSARLIDYQEHLLQELQEPKGAIAYLNAALTDEDPRIFLVALKNVLEARDIDISALAKKAHLNRENLYRILSSKGNPKLNSIIPLLNAVGLNLAIQPYKQIKH